MLNNKMRELTVTKIGFLELTFSLQDVGSKASEFGYLSGLYSMELIVGDAVLSNSFSWEVADVVLKFSDSAPVPSSSKDQYLYAPKPEIKVCSFLLSVCFFFFKTNCIVQYTNLCVRKHCILLL